ncbi:MAG: type IV pilus modification PilV family protein [bacterium]
MKNQQGFTLVEVLLSVIILSTGLLLIAELQITGAKGNKNSKDTSSAIILAESKIEELKDDGFSSLIDGNFPVGTSIPIDPSGAAGGIFTRRWTIRPYKNSSTMKHVEVNVTWADKGRSHSISLDTVLSDYLD